MIGARFRFLFVKRALARIDSQDPGNKNSPDARFLRKHPVARRMCMSDYDLPVRALSLPIYHPPATNVGIGYPEPETADSWARGANNAAHGTLSLAAGPTTGACSSALQSNVRRFPS
jgi:hypothetical protein